MNTAWAEMARNPCSQRTWVASDAMKGKVLACSALRQDQAYARSYESLKIDQDTWCGGPYCKPRCSKGVTCSRRGVFPFNPVCEDYLRRSGASSANVAIWHVVGFVLLLIHP